MKPDDPMVYPFIPAFEDWAHENGFDLNRDTHEPSQPWRYVDETTWAAFKGFCHALRYCQAPKQDRKNLV